MNDMNFTQWNWEISDNTSGISTSSNDRSFLTVSHLKQRTTALVNGDCALSDLFELNGEGEWGVRKGSKVLEGHFPHMPIVPGVMLKRLAKKMSGIDPYEKLKDGKPALKTEFLSPVLPNETVRTGSIDNNTVIESNGKTFVKFDKAGNDGEWISVLNGKSLGDITLSNTDSCLDRVLQSGAFRFVGHISDAYDFDGNHFGYGDYQFPLDCPFVEDNKFGSSIQIEIVEECVAQLWSAFFSRANGWEPLIKEDGTVEEKAKVLTFKSSIACLGEGKILPGERLRTIFKIEHADTRSVSFVYRTFSSMNEVVLEWRIEGNIVPYRILKRLAGNK